MSTICSSCHHPIVGSVYRAPKGGAVLCVSCFQRMYGHVPAAGAGNAVQWFFGGVASFSGSVFHPHASSAPAASRVLPSQARHSQVITGVGVVARAGVISNDGGTLTSQGGNGLVNTNGSNFH